MFDFLGNSPKPKETKNAGPLPILEQTLLKFPAIRVGGWDEWTVGDACEGTQIYGATGGGKTSGSGRAIAKAFLKKGFGGLVLCAKVDEREQWERYMAEAGRSEDLVIFSPARTEPRYFFNFLDYEMTRSGAGAGLTDNIAQLFTKALEFGGKRSGGGEDPYWELAMLQMLRNAIDLLAPAEETLSIESIYRVIISAPQSREEARSKEWAEKSFLFELIKRGLQNLRAGKFAERERDFKVSADYWTGEFASLSPRTRSSIVNVFTSMADGFRRGPMHELFCTTTNLLPEYTHEGAVILLDMPVKEYGNVGIVAQGIVKYQWQQAAERRRVTADTKPIFLWADESQFFANSYDMLFQTTARSARVATVYLTQNISNYYSVMPGDHGRAAVDSLMGNFQTKIFHTNGDAVTNKWASEQIGQNYQVMIATAHDGRTFRDSQTTTEQLLPDVLPSQFLQLKNGGTRNDRIVDAVLLKPGRMFSNERAHRYVAFSQEAR